MRKAQSAIELLVIISLVMVVLLIIFEFAMTKINESISMSQTSEARNTVDRLARAVVEVSNEGVGARRKIYITIPDRVNPNRIIIANTTITIGIYVQNGTSDISAPTSFPVVGGSYFPATPGSYWVWVVSRQGYVQVGTALEVSPLSEYFELFPSNSTSANISITNNGVSPLNVTLNLAWTDSEISATVNGTSSLSFNLPATSSSAQAVDLTVGANLNASQGLHSGYLSVTTNISESEIIPIVVNVVSPPYTSTGVLYLSIGTYNDSTYANPSTSFMAAGPTNVTYYKARSYNSTDGLVNSNVTVRVYNTTSAIVSEQTYPANNGTGVYIGNYTLPSTAPTGSWKITAYDIGGASAAMYFTVLPYWLTGWQYRKAHNITGSTAGAQTDYQVQIIVQNASGADSGNIVNINNKMRSDFGDIRFTNSSGTLLNYWMENYTSGTNATFWVKVDSIPASSNNATIYIYYGNSGATNISNGDNTFLFFDHFDNPNNALNTTKWTTYNSPTVSVANSWVTITTTTTGWKAILGTTSMLYGRWRSVGQMPENTKYEELGLAKDSTSWSVGTNTSSFYWTTEPGTPSYKIYVADATTYSYPSITSTTDVHIFEQLWKSGTIAYYIDGTLKYTETTHVPASTQTAHGAVHSASGTSTSKMDWVFLSKYVDPEPSHGAWGSEESSS